MEIRSTHPFTIVINSVIVALSCLLTPSLSASRELPGEFSAHYALVMLGTVMARAKYTLEHTEDGLVMTQSTRPAGIVALLRNDKIDVRSDMIVNNGKILLVNYDYNHTGDDRNRDVNVKIDWQTDSGRELTGKAVGTYEGKPVDIDLDLPVWDPLSIQVPIMIDASSQLPPHEHGLFMKGEFKYYRFENRGNDTIRVGDRQFTAINIVGRETERDRAMRVWLVPELNNLPVKIEQWKEGKLKSTVVLESVSLKNNGETQMINLTEDADDYQ